MSRPMAFPPAERGPGPTTAVAARNGVGFSSPLPYRIEVAAGDDLHRLALMPGGHNEPIAASDELVWVVFPEGAGGIDTLWDATALGLDIEFKDGGWLSDTGAVDQYGGGIDPGEQAAAKRLWVDQWNRRSVSLVHVAGRRVRHIVACVQASARRPVRVFMDSVSIGPAPAATGDPLDLVSTTRGTHSSDRFSRGNTAPLVAVPHGGVFGLPMTDASLANWPYSYHEHNRSDNRPALQAFATSHLPSPWMGDRGVFQVMPSPLPDPDPSRQGRALGFTHADELDRPHRYRVELDGGLSAELTAADFALGLRFTYPAATGAVIVDHHGSVRCFTLSQDGPETVLESLLDDRPGMPPHHVQVRLRGVIADHLTYQNDRLGGYLTVETGPGRTVDVLLAVSTIDAAQAADNLRAAGSFDDMTARAGRLWQDKLSTMTVTGASRDQQVSLFSGLYRPSSIRTGTPRRLGGIGPRTALPTTSRSAPAISPPRMGSGTLIGPPGRCSRCSTRSPPGASRRASCSTSATQAGLLAGVHRERRTA